MPKFDGTGPGGCGAMTGRGRGSCRNSEIADLKNKLAATESRIDKLEKKK